MTPCSNIGMRSQVNALGPDRELVVVLAVRRNAHGDVVAVKRAVLDETMKMKAGRPEEMSVQVIVNALLAGQEVRTRLSTGAPGPELKVVLAKGGHGAKSIALQHESLTVAHLPQF